MGEVAQAQLFMVEEDQYRKTYNSINERRCVFEKAILTRCCGCACAARFYLADREGVACEAAPAHNRCSHLLRLLRENARFALKVPVIGGELPHAKELKVQNGGLLGLQHVLRPDLHAQTVIDVSGLATLEQLPFREIVKSVVAYEGRRRPVSKR
jgi:hypothetical protein